MTVELLAALRDALDTYAYREALAILHGKSERDPAGPWHGMAAGIYEKLGLFGHALDMMLRAPEGEPDRTNRIGLFAQALGIAANLPAGRVQARDCTILITYRHDAPERLENTLLVIEYLRRVIDAPILLSEDAAEAPTFPDTGLVDQFIHIKGNTSPLSHLTKQINLSAEHVKTPYFMFCNADVLLSKMQLAISLDLIRGGCDVVFPFNGVWVNMARDRKEAVRGLADAAAYPLLSGSCTVQWDRSVGGAALLRLDRFRDLGGYNDRFIGWGYNDLEFFERCQKLSARIARAPGPILHIDHPRPEKGVLAERLTARNEAMYRHLGSLSAQEMRDLVDSGGLRRPYVNLQDWEALMGQGEAAAP